MTNSFLGMLSNSRAVFDVSIFLFLTGVLGKGVERDPVAIIHFSNNIFNSSLFVLTNSSWFVRPCHSSYYAAFNLVVKIKINRKNRNP